jgi:hypothetical protein
MKLFRCLIEGVNFPLDFEGELGLFGFYTTRFVRAEASEQAELLALEMLRAEPKLQVPPSTRTKDTMVYFKKIEEVTSLPDDVMEPGTGFAFYRMGTQVGA